MAEVLLKKQKNEKNWEHKILQYGLSKNTFYPSPALFLEVNK